MRRDRAKEFMKALQERYAYLEKKGWPEVQKKDTVEVK